MKDLHWTVRVAVFVVAAAIVWGTARDLIPDRTTTDPASASGSLVQELDAASEARPAAPAARPELSVSAVRVLFIGNSLTYANDLPGMVVRFGEAAGIVVETASRAPGGAQLRQHAADPATLGAIDAGGWDFVVLQEQSQLPALGDDLVNEDVLPAVRSLAERIRRASPRTRIVLYATMAHRDGDARNAEYVPGVASYTGMQRRLNRTYQRLSNTVRGTTAPVGAAWQTVRTRRPDLDLYADPAHPNRTGTYLAAAVLFSTMFRTSPVGSSFDAGLDGETALFLQRVAQDSAIR